MRRTWSGLLIFVLASAMAACGNSSTAPRAAAPPPPPAAAFAGTYALDSVVVTAFPKTLKPANGENGRLRIAADSFSANFSGLLNVVDSGSFMAMSNGHVTFSGSFFSGSGTAVLTGSSLVIQLTGGAAIGTIYGLFTKQ